MPSNEPKEIMDTLRESIVLEEKKRTQRLHKEYLNLTDRQRAVIGSALFAAMEGNKEFNICAEDWINEFQK